MTETETTPTAATPLRVARKVVVGVMGATVLTFGIALIVLPGPAVIVIPLGLAILATEFLWARRLLRRVKQGATLLFTRRRSGRAPTGLRATKPVAVAMLAVVTTFSISLAFSQFHLRHIEDQALEVIQYATPSVEHLAGVQTELRRQGMYVNEYVARIGNGRTASREDISAARRQLAAEFTAYQALASPPGESEYVAGIAGALALLDESTEQVLNETDASSFDAARRTLHEAFHPRLERADAAVVRLRTSHSDRVRARAESILAARRTSNNLAIALGCASVLISLIASALVVRLLRARARLVEEHGRLLDVRSTEMEAFAGRVAHDLKNPLGAVALRVMSAQRAVGLDPKVRDHFDKLGRQVERMDHIIDGLLEFARAGANPPPGVSADLKDILDDVVTDVRPAAEAAKAELRIDSFAPAKLACTPGALTSVLSNLLGNAVKYIVEGREATRRISVHVRDLDNGVRVEVEDTGPGLPPGSEERAFQPFRRLTETKQPGIGLGLATVKKVVEAYKGRVGVHSRPGEGSSFWFEIPKAGKSAMAPADGFDGPSAARARHDA